MTKIRGKDIDSNFGWGDDVSINMEEVSSACLFPPQGKEKAELAIKNLRELLGREYKMREWVFRQDPKKKAQKLKEIQEAYEWLRDIEDVLDDLGGCNE